MSAAFNLAVEVSILIIISILISIVGFIVGRALATKDYPMTFERFESGNPPVGRGKGWFVMQYYPYALMFMIIEPIIIFLLFLLVGFKNYPIDALLIAVISISIALPAILFANGQAKVIEKWKME